MNIIQLAKHMLFVKHWPLWVREKPYQALHWVQNRAFHLLHKEYEAQGMHWVLPKHFQYGEAVSLRNGSYEHAERSMVGVVLAKLEGRVPCVFIDLGSNIGATARTLCDVMPDNSQLICVEANPQSHNALEENLKRIQEGLQKRVDIVCIKEAIAAPDIAQASFYCRPNLSSGLADFQSAQSDNATTVKTVSLSQLLKKRVSGNAPFFLSSDIEGGEIAILRHDSEALRNCVGIAIELHETTLTGQDDAAPEQLKNEFEALGFECVAIDKNVYGFVRVREQPVQPVLPSQKATLIENLYGQPTAD